MSSRILGFTAIILAAGRSARLGRNKLLVSIDGEPLVRRSVGQAVIAGAAEVVVVTGFEADLVAAALSGTPATLAHNEAWEKGMGGSIAVGVRRAMRPGAPGATDVPAAAAANAGTGALAAGASMPLMIILPDQYEVPAAHLHDLVVAAARTDATIVATAYSGTVGVPALFKPTHAGALMALPLEGGAKRLFEDHRQATLVIPCPIAAIDLDTPADLARLYQPGLSP